MCQQRWDPKPWASCSKSLQGLRCSGPTGDPFLIWGRGLQHCSAWDHWSRKWGCRGGHYTEENQLGIGSLAQEGLCFQGPVGDSPCPLCRGDPVPLTRVILTAPGLFLTHSLLNCLG